MTTTFLTKYGKITLYNNEVYIGDQFKNGIYWDEDTLLKLKQYIDPDKNILEIGGHCGTSSIIYASFLNNTSKHYVYEPQKNMYNLLVKNINDNKLENIIIPFNKGVFCYNGKGNMNNIDLDGGLGNVQKRYNEESNLPCNFGGISLGIDGEEIDLVTIDEMNIENLGFIHCDAQGSENFIFSTGIETIKKYRPIILYENNYLYGKYLYDTVSNNYNYENNKLFNIKDYCINNLSYSTFIDRFNGGIDTLLIP
jgi:FkbM family methyltransferase